MFVHCLKHQALDWSSLKISGILVHAGKGLVCRSVNGEKSRGVSATEVRSFEVLTRLVEMPSYGFGSQSSPVIVAVAAVEFCRLKMPTTPFSCWQVLH
jgi:hypothetical protein